MRREDRLVLSHRPYAADLTSLRTTEHPRGDGSSFWHGRVDAVWFRRRRGELVACIGSLWGSMGADEPATAEEFLTRLVDGRYGGDALGRWDGKGYWGNVSLETQQQHLAVLQPALARFPEVPAGCDGWWVF